MTRPWFPCHSRADNDEGAHNTPETRLLWPPSPALDSCIVSDSTAQVHYLAKLQEVVAGGGGHRCDGVPPPGVLERADEPNDARGDGHGRGLFECLAEVLLHHGEGVRDCEDDDGGVTAQSLREVRLVCLPVLADGRATLAVQLEGL
eukprot:2891029-Pyramimonas_sp.AAC.1